MKFSLNTSIIRSDDKDEIKNAKNSSLPEIIAAHSGVQEEEGQEHSS